MMQIAWKTWLLLSLTLAFGCDAKKYGLAPVSGVVTLDGEPVPGAIVNFQPKSDTEKSPGPGSTGRCDATGRFVLETIRQEPGAVVGTHRVKVYSYSPESPVVADTDTDAVERKELFPTWCNYNTELTFDVPSGGTTEADFHLDSYAR
jgi:hypothetical protein